MRKKTISFGLDNIFWYIVYLLPIICFLVYIGTLGGNLSNLPTFYDFISSHLGLPIVLDNVFVTTVASIFGSNGIVPLLDTSVTYGIIAYLCYFVACYFVHFVVDILMLLPRMLMHAMDKFAGGC